MLRRSTRLALPLTLAAAVAALALAGAGWTGSPCGPAPSAARAEASSAAARGARIAALDRSAVVTIDDSGERTAHGPPFEPRGLLRHAATASGAGIAYVDDVRGADQVVLVTPAGTERIEGGGEVTHPAVAPGGQVAWAEDMSRLVVRGPSGVTRSFPPPADAVAVFAPAFAGPAAITAVAAEPVPGVPHDAALDNLFRLDTSSGEWTRLTSFGADDDRWSAIRTPLVARDGTTFFVRVSGRATATEPASFQLWRLDGSGASKVRDLPGEAYLAGVLGDGPVWNVFDEPAEVWRLIAEGGGAPRELGCGAAGVDPRAEADPDLLPEAEEGSAEDEPEPEAVAGDGGMALVIGDFDSRGDAGVVAGRVAATRRQAVVIDHDDAPIAVAPGAFAVAVPLDPGDDVMDELGSLRERFPDLAERIWVGALEG